MSAVIQPQPAACASCGSPFAEPFCEHVRVALAALAADPRELRTVDDYFADVEPLFADPVVDETDAMVSSPQPRRYSGADLRRGFCPTAGYYAVRRAS